ncbi:MAG: ImmA/IrrE family metallo-endopeptidase [Roseburia sp.]|nr:ImmA/IrrE family metallo-endopeptidase [Roseburia sp.]
MIYHDYSLAQLEAFADDLNRRYDAARLTTPKQVDVYDIVDLLGARIAFEYLSPDRTYLGATLFQPGILYVWPGNPYIDGMVPTLKPFHGGTIIIDRDLNESTAEQDHFTENYTVMHECFHFDKHQKSFRHAGHLSKSFLGYERNQNDRNSALFHIERQANYASAAFLMPREAVKVAAEEVLHYDGQHRLVFCYDIKPKIKEVGRLFGVNYSPMTYRLQELDILDWNFNSRI